jgi:hypothetical protein
MGDKPVYDTTWQAAARCRGTDPGPWSAAEHAVDGLHAHDKRHNARSTVNRVYMAHLDAAACLATCRECPVREQCLNLWALPDGYTGVAGGLLVRDGDVLADIIVPPGAPEMMREHMRTYLVDHAIEASGATALTSVTGPAPCRPGPLAGTAA